eukprot:gene7568-10310_t
MSNSPHVVVAGGVIPYIMMRSHSSLTLPSMLIVEHDNLSLLEAIQYDRPQQVRSILKQCSVDMDFVDQEDGETFLCCAAVNGSIEIIDLLISHGGDINQTNVDGETPFYCACAYGQTSVVTHLMSLGCDVGKPDKDGLSPLIKASVLGYANIVNLLISTKPAEAFSGHTANAISLISHLLRPDIRDMLESVQSPDRKSLLPYDEHSIKQLNQSFLLAVKDNDYSAFEIFINDSRLNINYQDEYYGGTPLYWAVTIGSLKILNLLLINGANPNIEDMDGLTPLFVACNNGLVDIARQLILHGANPNKSNKWGATPLLCASWNGSKQIITMLLANGADVNAVNHVGYTSLYCAVYQNQEDIVKMILDYGAVVNFPTSEGTTPLFCAVKKGNSNLVQLLVEHNANVHISNNDGMLPFDIAKTESVKEILKNNATIRGKACENLSHQLLSAALHNDIRTIRSLMMKEGMDINYQDNETKKSALYNACNEGYTKLAQILLEEYHADPNMKTENNLTPLYNACMTGNLSIVELLLKFKANPNISDNNGWSPLYCACFYGNDSIALAIIRSNRVDLNITTNDNETPLWWTSVTGNDVIARALLEYGANPNICNMDDESPLWWASYNGHEQIVDLLLQNGAHVSKLNKAQKGPYDVCTSNRIKSKLM